MRRYGLLLLVLCLTTASLLAAAAYTSATITNAATMQVVNTNRALLSLRIPHGGTWGEYMAVADAYWPNWNFPGPGYKDGNAYFGTDGRLYFDFTKGVGGYALNPSVTTGFQPGSTYIFEKLFWVHNESKSAIQYTVTVSGDWSIYVTIIGPTGGLASNTGNWVGLRFDVPVAPTHLPTQLVLGQLIVSAVATD